MGTTTIETAGWVLLGHLGRLVAVGALALALVLGAGAGGASAATADCVAIDRQIRNTANLAFAADDAGDTATFNNAMNKLQALIAQETRLGC